MLTQGSVTSLEIAFLLIDSFPHPLDSLTLCHDFLVMLQRINPSPLTFEHPFCFSSCTFFNQTNTIDSMKDAISQSEDMVTVETYTRRKLLLIRTTSETNRVSRATNWWQSMGSIGETHVDKLTKGNWHWQLVKAPSCAIVQIFPGLRSPESTSQAFFRLCVVELVSTSQFKSSEKVSLRMKDIKASKNHFCEAISSRFTYKIFRYLTRL